MYISFWNEIGENNVTLAMNLPADPIAAALQYHPQNVWQLPPVMEIFRYCINVQIGVDYVIEQSLMNFSSSWSCHEQGEFIPDQ